MGEQRSSEKPGTEQQRKKISVRQRLRQKAKRGGLWRVFSLNEKQRMFVLLFLLWAAIGYLDLMGLAVGRGYPVSVLYVLVILPAAVVFGKTGLGVATLGVIVMYHFTNDKDRLSSYTETEILRLAFIFIIGIGFERISRDRANIRRALAKLQRETSVREDLTHMLVHDLRTPLTGIITSLQTLQHGILGELDKDQLEMVEFAVNDGQRLLEMVNQILDVARLETGEMPLRLQNSDLAEVADSACRLVKPLALESGVKLEQAVDDVNVRIDPDLIRRVLINLLGNAVKFTPRDGEVSLLLNSNGDGKAHLEVQDTGWGIPSSDLKRIFDKYAQVKGSDKAGPSTGLGLTFCRLAVEAHGGRIWAESEVGKGTTMHIELPIDGPPKVTTPTES